MRLPTRAIRRIWLRWPTIRATRLCMAISAMRSCWRGSSTTTGLGRSCTLRRRAMWTGRSWGRMRFCRRMWTGRFGCCRRRRKFYETLTGEERESFRFLHVSTDEVYGTLEPDDPAFSETTPFAPNSPYAASKASSDMLVRAWTHTYKLPTLMTNCSNNYGPYQFPEKLIPLMIQQRAGGQAAAGVWRWAAGAETGCMWSTTARRFAGAARGTAGRDVQRRRE